MNDDAFGDMRTFPASDRAKKQMKELVSKGLFHEQRDAWRLGAALGIVLNQSERKGKRETFQNINSLDPEGIFAAIMIGLYPDITPEERAKKLVDSAEWGINQIHHQVEIGTLDWSQLGLLHGQP
ncbi:MAG: hypothetical protein ABOK23_09075 [Candidatus Methanoperedens sp.]|nr:hypothetical protein [Candidatus Methanoperedens sp.]MCZ7394281.1 hypothetical protein [Candidatus Methanoperedens sp.]